MPKTIKFNLIVNDVSIRSLEALQENFNIHDVLELHHAGVLGKWLRVRGHDDLDAALQEAGGSEGGDAALIRRMVEAFGIEASEHEIQEAIYAAGFHHARRAQLQAMLERAVDEQTVITRYHHDYWKLIDDLRQKTENYAFIKQALAQAWERFPELVRLHYKELHNEFFETAPLVIFAALMHRDLRTLFLGNETIAKNLKKAATDASVQKKIPQEYLKRYSEATDSFWKDLEQKGQRVMVIEVPHNTFIRSTGTPGEQIPPDQANGQYLILDGLDYKNNNKGYTLTYMVI